MTLPVDHDLLALALSGGPTGMKDRDLQSLHQRMRLLPRIMRKLVATSGICGRVVRLGAVAPSSRWLAAIVTADITSKHAPVIELGPGTGAVTCSLLARGVPAMQLTLIERESVFVDLLRRHFPETRVLHLDACRLRDLKLFSGKRAGAVISSLPILLMRRQNLAYILAGAFLHLREDGAFYQFTYGRVCPFPKQLLDEFDLYAENVGQTLMNFPPATVYRISRNSGFLELSSDREGNKKSAEVKNFGARVRAV